MTISTQYCPHCGEPTFTKQQGIRHLCSACGFEYFHNTAAAVAGIIECNGEILLTRRAKDPKAGLLDLPGGFVDPGETLEHAISREVEEELSVKIENWRYIASEPNEYLYKGILYNTLDTLFVCSIAGKPTLTLEKSEIAEATWIDKSSLRPEELAFVSQARLVRKYLAEN